MNNENPEISEISSSSCCLLSSLVSAVHRWAEEREIFDHASSLAQGLKTLEESTELMEALVNQDQEKILDGIGDVLVTLIIQAELQNLTLQDCLLQAYSDIKDRKGKMVNGTFVKEKESSNE